MTKGGLAHDLSGWTLPDHLLRAGSDLDMMLGNPKGRFSGLDRGPRATGTTNVPPAQELENQWFSRNQNKVWGSTRWPRGNVERLPPGTRSPAPQRGCENGRPRQHQLPRPQPDPRPSSTPALPPPARPCLPQPRPARPGPALTHLQAQGRPAGAQELADVAQALALVSRLRVDLQHTAALSGPDASSAPLPRAAPISAPAHTRKRARDRK